MSIQQGIQGKGYQREVAEQVNALTEIAHGLAVEAGWWSNPETGERITRNDGELIALIHSEVSEALEAVRKDLDDDHLQHHKGVTVEMADAIVRILDYCGSRGLPVGEALAEKLAYNARRADHQAAARLQANGKKF